MTIAQEGIANSAIAKWLGFNVTETELGARYHLTFNDAHIGNPVIRALHGGVIANFLEVTAQCELAATLADGAVVRTVNIDVDYLTASKAQNMTAKASITRLGRRIAFVEATGWQDSKDRPVAQARLRLRIGNSSS